MFRKLTNQLTLWQRNRKKHDKLDAADAVLLRYPKSGVTWLRMMMSRVYTQRLGVDIPHLIGSSEFERQAPSCPRLFVAMDNIGLTREAMLARIEQKKIILLLRDPRDIVVSLYFHFCKRSTLKERLAFNVPDDLESRGLFDFVMNPTLGLKRIIEFEEFWRNAVERRPDTLVLHYEELRKDAEGGLGRMMRLMGTEASADEIAAAVAFSSFENMKKLEAQQSFGAGLLKPGNASDADSFKVRKGKVGGYRDYLTEAEAQAVDALMAQKSTRTPSARRY
jgi:hypothetical protein